MTIVDHDGNRHELAGRMATIFLLLLQEREAVEAGGGKAQIVINCAGNEATADITKKSARLVLD